MILGFMQNFPWKEPTNFREKILKGAGKYICDFTADGVPIIHDIPKTYEFSRNISIDFNSKEGVKSIRYDPPFLPKIHTLREDIHDRWKPGMSIQMVYRGPKYSILDHFNKDIPELQKCVSVQKIEIDCFDLGNPGPFKIDGRWIEDPNEILKISHNDGFKDAIQFARWFRKPFTGKIIHWTDLRY